jgi:hypothetical protein
MTITLELPQDLEAELTAEAERLHLPLEDYLVRVLATGRIAPPPARTPAELVAYWQREGIIGWGPEGPDSPEYARMLREQNQNRQHP